MPKDGVKATEAGAVTTPVLAIGLGRGGGGKSTMLAEMVWRAKAAGRKVLVADGDVRSATLHGLFPDAVVPKSEEMADVSAFLSGVLSRMVSERLSAVLDLGGGDRALLDFGRDLRLIEFCARRKIEPLAVYCLGPDEEDLAHISSIFEAGYFRPKRALLLMSEGVIRGSQHVSGAFDRTMDDPRFKAMIGAGARPITVNRLACMGLFKKENVSPGFYDAARGLAALDPVQEFMVEDWCADLEAKRVKREVSEWLP